MAHLIDIVADNFFIAMGGVCILAGMGCKAVTAIFTSATRERTRREIAAYIAEGSISPDQGERLMRAEVNCGSRSRAA